eukprot:1745686-Heterocapsa_arctica.AAC.1
MPGATERLSRLSEWREPGSAVKWPKVANVADARGSKRATQQRGEPPMGQAQHDSGGSRGPQAREGRDESAQ